MLHCKCSQAYVCVYCTQKISVQFYEFTFSIFILRTVCFKNSMLVFLWRDQVIKFDWRLPPYYFYPFVLISANPSFFSNSFQLALANSLFHSRFLCSITIILNKSVKNVNIKFYVCLFIILRHTQQFFS